MPKTKEQPKGYKTSFAAIMELQEPFISTMMNQTNILKRLLMSVVPLD
jgi:hypothetical protein